jgi:hypothetical protein
MRALTLWQPWASAIVSGRKRVENRPWAPKLIKPGERFAIHAGKRWDRSGAVACAERGFDLRRAEALGGVIGVATLDRVVRSAADLPADQRAWFFGPVGWLLRDVLTLPRPVPARGMLGLWLLPDDVEAAVLGML